MTSRDPHPFYEHVADLCPGTADGERERAVHATLRALDEQLMPEEMAMLCAEFPKELVDALQQQPSPTPTPPDRATLLKRVATLLQVPEGHGIELAEFVCRALAQTSNPVAIEHLQKNVPELAPLFDLPEAPEPVHTTHTARGAHAHSVARSHDPHGATKLSSSRATTQEQEQRTPSSYHGAKNDE